VVVAKLPLCRMDFPRRLQFLDLRVLRGRLRLIARWPAEGAVNSSC
jgi:hypothetical protein